MSFSTQVQLPDWTRLNPLFDNDAIQQDHAITAIRQNSALAGTQDLEDRSTLRGLAGGLAARDPQAQAGAAVLPVGVPAVNALASADASSAASKLAALQYSNGLISFPGASAPANSVPMSSGTGGIDPSTGMPAGLGTRESGNNPGAVNKQGYSGSLQFGTGRLADLGMYQPAQGENPNGNQWQGTITVPGFQPMTHQQFLQNPDAQRMAAEVHAKDINTNIDNTPGADKFNRTGLMAVAHLGGIQGMQQFVATGGQYNPHDANGTSLQNYYDKFSQGGAPALQQSFGHPDGPLPTTHPARGVQVASTAGTTGMPAMATDATPAPASSATLGAGPIPIESMPAPTGMGQPTQVAQGGALPMAQQDVQPSVPPQQTAGQAPQSGAPPGTTFARTGAGQLVTQGAPPGYALARFPDGTTGYARAPGVPAPVEIKDAGGVRSIIDKNTGQTIRTEAIPDHSRMQTIVGPDGTTLYQSGKPIATLPPNTRPEQATLLNKDYEQVSGLGQQARDLEGQIQKTIEARDAAANLPTGAGYDSRQNVSNWLQTYFPSVADRVKGTMGGALPDSAQGQQAAKLLMAQAAADEKAMGGSGGLGLTQMYANNNPNLNMQPSAIRDMSNLKAVTAMAAKDYAQGKIDHVTTHGQEFLNGTAQYVPAAMYDKQWFSQNNTNTYMGAINAMNGKPYAEWSKGLSQQDAARALGVVARIDPTVTVDGRNGHPLAVSKFMPTNLANPAAPQ